MKKFILIAIVLLMSVGAFAKPNEYTPVMDTTFVGTVIGFKHINGTYGGITHYLVVKNKQTGEVRDIVINKDFTAYHIGDVYMERIAYIEEPKTK